jgi:hypothetical protein
VNDKGKIIDNYGMGTTNVYNTNTLNPNGDRFPMNSDFELVDEIKKDMKNQVIKVLTREHGKKVIEYWKSKGIDTRGHLGMICERDGDKCIYYGVIDDVFSNYSIKQVNNGFSNVEIIELPEEEFDMSTIEGRLAYAKKTYAAGTKFISPQNDRTYEVGKYITINTPIYEGSYGNILTRTSGGGGGEFIFYDGIWAEIIKEEFDMNTNEGRLAYAKKHYPIGTKYIPIDCDGNPYVRKDISTYDARLWANGLGIEVGDGLIYHLLTNTWAEIIKEDKQEEKVMETQKLSRQGLKEIHSVACPTWQRTLANYGTRNPLEDYIELTQNEVDKMFAACTKEQLPIVSKYLKQDDGSVNVMQFRCDIYDNGGRSVIQKRFDGDYANKSLLLDNYYDWEIKKDNKGYLCLIPTKKK